MKKVWIILTAVLAMTACKKDDDNGGNHTSDGITEDQLKSFTFTNRRVFIGDDDITSDVLRGCDMDNDYRFLDEGRIQVLDHGQICPDSPDGGWVTDPGTWQLLPGGTSMVHYDATMKVALGTTKLTLTDPNNAGNYTTYDIK